MADQLKAGVWETTQTTGTGSVTLMGAKSGRRTFQAAFANGATCKYRLEGTWGFEEGIGTLTFGASNTLARTTVVRNYLGTTARVNLPEGTHNVYCSILAERTPQTDEANTWTADQWLQQKKLLLAASNGNDYVQSTTNGRVAVFLEGEESFRLSYNSGVQQATLYSYDGTDLEGPELRLDRDSATPAASDNLGVIRFLGRDAAGNSTTYGKIGLRLMDPTDGSEDGRLVLSLMTAGSLSSVLEIADGFISARTGMGIFTGSKTGSAPSSVGAEMLATGQMIATVSGDTCMIANRTTSDGTLVSFRRNNTEQGAISVSGSTVSYGAFAGHHDSRWAGAPPPILQRGMVVEAAPGLYDDEREPLVQLAGPQSRAVYGVFARDNPSDDDPHRIMVMGLGAYPVWTKGPVRRGDLLEVSDQPGVAWVQDDDLVRASTVAKATQDDDREHARLVPAVLMCG